MITKYSLKKPMTVLVAVVLSLVLGVAAIAKVQTDFLPQMEMPYVIIVTVCPGFTPEKVETAVTKPLESSLSTLGGVADIRSQSEENMCLLSIEFSYKTNMDAAMIELNNRLASISATFEKGVGAPFMMQIDPDMMPVYIASVSEKGADLKKLTGITNDFVVPTLEKTEGVASVMAMGTLLDNIQVTLNQEKIDAANEKIVALTDKKTASALEEINKGKRALSAAKKELETQRDSASLKTAQAGIALSDGKAAIMAGIVALESSEAQIGQILDLLDRFGSGAALPGGLDKIDTKQAASLLLTLSDYLEKGASVSGDLADRLIKADPAKIDWKAIKKMLGGNAKAWKAVEKIRSYLSDTLGPGGSLTLTMKNLSTEMAENSVKMKSLAEQVRDLEPGSLLNSLLAPISELRSSMEQAKAAFPAQKEDLKQKLDELSGHQVKVEQGKIILATELAMAGQKIQSSEEKLAEGEAKLKEALEKAASKAGLSSLLDKKMLTALITAQNLSMPAGYLEDGGKKFTVKIGDALESIDDLKNLPLVVSGEEGIGTITLSDVADIAVKDNSGENFAKVNGSDGILLVLQKQSMASTSAVSKELRRAVEKLEKEHQGLEINTLMDQGVYIDVVINSVLNSLIVGGILAALVLFVFLMSIRATLIVSFSIPLSLMLSLVMMYFADVSVNIISLAGLALCVGMLVDNSIVVIENTYRLRATGIPAGKAALLGAKQMSGAITASTLTTVCVFLPIVFTKGISRQLFTDMGLTIAFSLLSSLLVALSLVPVLSAVMLRDLKGRMKERYSRAKNVYVKMLSYCLDKKWLPIGLSIALLAVSIYGGTRLGTAFIPDSAAEQLMVTVSLPEDAEIDSEKLRERSLAVMDAICELDDVETVGVYDMPDSAKMSVEQKKSLAMYIVMSENKSKSTKKVTEDIRKKAGSVPGCETSLSQGANILAFMEKGVEVRIKGEKINILRDLAGKTADLLSKTEGLEKIDDGFSNVSPEIRITVDKEKAMERQITVGSVLQQIADAIQDPSLVTALSAEGGDIDIMLRSKEEDRLTYETLKSFSVTYTDAMTGETGSVPLSDIADISVGENLSAIARENLNRVVSVKAGLKDGYNIGLVSRDLEKRLKGIELPKGYSISIVGENEMINTALRDVGFMLILAVIMIYLIMVAQFQSLTGPFVVMFTIPLAFTGGLFALWIFGFELSVISVLGFLVLAGVVVNNGIVFVDTSNQLQRDGMPRREALIETGRIRLRPILMTAVTTVLGLTSLALGIGTGADMLQPLAVVVIFGLAYATLLTLFLVPVLCDGIFMRKPARGIDFEEEEN